MRPELRDALLKLAQDALNGNKLDFNMDLLNTNDQDKICLTLKNYRQPKGVSTQIHDIVPVLDAPERIENIINEDDGTLSQECNQSGDFNSPDKIIKETNRALRYGQKDEQPKVYMPSEAMGMA